MKEIDCLISIGVLKWQQSSKPINAIWFLPELTITSTMQLSFHEGVGDHRTVLVNISAKSAIGKQEFLHGTPSGPMIDLDQCKSTY